MDNTDKHFRVVKSTDELARAIDQIRMYREEFAERHAEARGGYAPKKREYPEETVVLSPDSDAEPILWDYRDMLFRLHVTCKPKQGRVRLHLVAPDVFDLMLGMRFVGFFDLDDKMPLMIDGPCVLVSPMPIQMGTLRPGPPWIGADVEFRVDPRIAAETPEQACMVEDVLSDGAEGSEDGGEGDA